MTDPEVVIVGAGPAGLVLAWMLQRAEVPYVLVDRQSRDRIGTLPKAGIVEYRTVELLRREGFPLTFDVENRRVEFRTPELRHVFDYADLTGDRPHYVFPQHRLVAELATALLAEGAPLLFDHAVTDVDPDRPSITAGDRTFTPRAIVGADGAGSVVARSLAGRVEVLDRPLASRWLVVSARTAPLVGHTIYAIHPRGYAAHLRRGPEETRFYLEVPAEVSGADLDPDDLRRDLAERLGEPGALDGVEIGVDDLDLRTRITTPMQVGGAFLVGDAAHLITPAGGKGMNLAVADAVELAHGLIAAHRGDPGRLEAYTDTRLPVIAETQGFSDWFLRVLSAFSTDAVGGSGSAAFVDAMRQGWVRRLRDDPLLARWFAHAYAGVDA
ncbi:4-hydroxybenzoate 3-monooxygenase [Actinomycetospora corticicola]|uniref:p-hydroxybenzoate 3-monooxygenase n=1 Tax=Actinomycetospora corticicola TaxID=663602 RepID=A0A7Y9DX81_9PSEU|nr:FAD-dependent monooxygenase [Actinomycetospora corticicola]NYD37121.1 p-hydroxybenzoate 3-monooxygenase [Actinomycetospora corticicola]